jgi:hypothetical protein
MVGALLGPNASTLAAGRSNEHSSISLSVLNEAAKHSEPCLPLGCSKIVGSSAEFACTRGRQMSARRSGFLFRRGARSQVHDAEESSLAEAGKRKSAAKARFQRRSVSSTQHNSEIVNRGGPRCRAHGVTDVGPVILVARCFVCWRKFTRCCEARDDVGRDRSARLRFVEITSAVRQGEWVFNSAEKKRADRGLLKLTARIKMELSWAGNTLYNICKEWAFLRAALATGMTSPPQRTDPLRIGETVGSKFLSSSYPSFS